MFDNITPYGLTEKREVLPSKNDVSIKYCFKAMKKSVDDLEFVALDCIKRWRWYSLLFFNCRDFAYRLTLHLQKENKLFGDLLPYIPVLYDDWFIKSLRASSYAIVYKLIHNKDESMLIHLLKRTKLDFLTPSMIRMYDIVGYVLLAQIAWNLSIESVKLMHQKHEYN